jgi:flagellar hook-associated protein 3 FlgL
VSTGLRLQKASDDPNAAAQTMRARSSLRALEQYRRNIDLLESRVSAEEGVLDQLSDVLSRAQELGLSQRGATANASTRAVAKAEVDQILDFVVGLGNTKFGDEYLFGGAYSDQPPFDPTRPDFLSLDSNGDPRIPQGEKQAEISSGRYLKGNHDGKQVFLDTGVIQAIKELSDALASPTPDQDLGNALVSLESAFDSVQSLIGEVGARINQLQVTNSNLDALDLNLQTLKSNLEEVDLEKAVTELVSRQTSMQAAMLATSRVMGLTLADYLR